MYQKRNYSSRRSYGGRGGIDWKRTILYCAIFFVLFNALIGLVGFKGIFIACLIVIGYLLGPNIWRNIKLNHRTKQSRNRKVVKRYEIIDLED